MTKEEIKEFVQKWMNGHEEDTFIKNQYGTVIYSAGASSLNLTCFFEDLLSDFTDELQSENERLKSELSGNPEQLGWVSVKDRLPEEYGDVIIFGRFTKDIRKTVYEASFNPKNRRFSSIGIYSKDVTHWMNLPEPPKQ